MNKTFALGVCLSLISVSAFAKSKVDFSVMDEPDHGRLHECMKEAWDAASPSDEQEAKAEALMKAAHEVVEAQKPAIKSAMGAMIIAWKKYPIVRDEVVAAEGQMATAVMPVREAIRDTHIDVLNLLSAEQRADADAAFIDCIRPGK